ncbi:MAG: IclR family transcriptional regulator [Solirubrobacteraceae bacterium]
MSAVLDVLDTIDRDGPVTLTQLSRRTGVAKSTLHRVCSLMGERGWIVRDVGNGLIEFGPRAAWLARGTPASVLSTGFHAVGGRLVALHNETTCLTVLDGRETVFIAKEETSHPVRLVTAVGNRLPAFASAAGRVILADLPEAEVRDRYASCELETPTGRRLAGIGELLRILRETRARGYGENMDETALGLHCIAAPVGPRGRAAAAITLCVPTGRMNAARKREMLRDLLVAAQELGPPIDLSLSRSTNFGAAATENAFGAASTPTER